MHCTLANTKTKGASALIFINSKPNPMTTTNTEWFDNPAGQRRKSLARTNAIADRCRVILSAINNYIPQQFAAKPFTARAVENNDGWVEIVCRSSDTEEIIHTFLLSEHDHWEYEIVAEDMITDLIQVQYLKEA